MKVILLLKWTTRLMNTKLKLSSESYLASMNLNSCFSLFTQQNDHRNQFKATRETTRSSRCLEEPSVAFRCTGELFKCGNSVTDAGGEEAVLGARDSYTLKWHERGKEKETFIVGEERKEKKRRDSQMSILEAHHFLPLKVSINMVMVRKGIQQSFWTELKQKNVDKTTIIVKKVVKCCKRAAFDKWWNTLPSFFNWGDNVDKYTS